MYNCISYKYIRNVYNQQCGMNVMGEYSFITYTIWHTRAKYCILKDGKGAVVMKIKKAPTIMCLVITDGE